VHSILPLGPEWSSPRSIYTCTEIEHQIITVEHTGLWNSPGFHWQPEVASGVHRTSWSCFSLVHVRLCVRVGGNTVSWTCWETATNVTGHYARQQCQYASASLESRASASFKEIKMWLNCFGFRFVCHRKITREVGRGIDFTFPHSFLNIYFLDSTSCNFSTILNYGLYRTASRVGRVPEHLIGHCGSVAACIGKGGFKNKPSGAVVISCIWKSALDCL
jgi:hypothetical protein